MGLSEDVIVALPSDGEFAAFLGGRHSSVSVVIVQVQDGVIFDRQGVIFKGALDGRSHQQSIACKPFHRIRLTTIAYGLIGPPSGRGRVFGASEAATVESPCAALGINPVDELILHGILTFMARWSSAIPLVRNCDGVQRSTIQPSSCASLYFSQSPR